MKTKPLNLLLIKKESWSFLCKTFFIFCFSLHLIILILGKVTVVSSGCCSVIKLNYSCCLAKLKAMIIQTLQNLGCYMLCYGKYGY